MSFEQNNDKVQERQDIANSASPVEPVKVDPTATSISNNIPEKKKRGRPPKSDKVKTGAGLKLGFKPDSGDKNPPKPSDTLSASGAGIAQAPTVDYHSVATGLITMIDGMMKVVSMMTKGRLEYEPLNSQEKNVCATALENEKGVLEFMSKTQGMNHLIVLATLAGVFMPKIKYKAPPPKDKNDKGKEKPKNDGKTLVLTEKNEQVRPSTAVTIQSASLTNGDMEI